jgi:hypothetical protein
MTLRSSLLLVALAMVLTACGGAQPPAEERPPQRKQTVFDPLTSTLDRAKGVQQTVDDQAAEQRKKLEAAEK